MESLDDDEGEVRHQALLALSSLDGKMTPAQTEVLEERFHELMETLLQHLGLSRSHFAI